MYLITLTDWLSSRIRSFQKLSGIGDIQKPTKKRRILSYTTHIVGQPKNAPTKRNKQSLKGFTRLNNPREWVAATYISYRAFVIRLKEPLSYMFITPPKNTENPKKSLFFLFMCIHEICFFIFHFSFFICFVILVLLSTPSRLTVCRRGGKFWRHCTQTAVDIGVEQLCFFDVRAWMWVFPPPFIFFLCCALLHTEIDGIKKKKNEFYF